MIINFLIIIQDKYEINETLAEDLGDFLLQLVQEQLEN